MPGAGLTGIATPLSILVLGEWTRDREPSHENHLSNGRSSLAPWSRKAGGRPREESAYIELDLTSTSIHSKVKRMRTTLDIPEELLEEARRLLGFKSKTDAIVLALRELIRRARIEDLKKMMGAVRLELDIPASRRRPRNRS